MVERRGCLATYSTRTLGGRHGPEYRRGFGDRTALEARTQKSGQRDRERPNATGERTQTKGKLKLSYKPEVIADNSGKFAGNALRFATREEAEANVRDLAMRWTSVRETRVVESDDPVNYRWENGRLVPLEKSAS